MNLRRRIDVLTELSLKLSDSNEEFELVKKEAFLQNNWFTGEYVVLAVENIKKYLLDRSDLLKWTNSYFIPHLNTGKKVGIIMAGNIPLVGFHDLLSVFISGHTSLIKLSSKDEVLMNFMISKLIEIDPEISDLIKTVDRLSDIDAVIATGSNNSFRYFEYYFGKIPNIIRKNRNSIAILAGNESVEDLEFLVSDIQTYFGLGCRNISKLFVPSGYDFSELIGLLNRNAELKMHNKYMNNYEYNLAVSLINNDEVLQGENVFFKKDTAYISRLAVINYEEYNDSGAVTEMLKIDKDQLQLIATQSGSLTGLSIELKFGETQNPRLWDYADEVDTMAFLNPIQ
jgi:hypothetical protein